MTRKIVVAGGRDIEDDTFVEKKMLELIGNDTNIEIVNGICPTGVDRSARKIAKKYSWKIIPFPAEWRRFGKKAGPLRNEKMAIYADEALVIWNGKSKGSGGMLALAKQYMKQEKVKEVIYE